MEFSLSDEKLERLVEKEIAHYVREQVERVMNNGKAYWFFKHRYSKRGSYIYKTSISS